MLYNENSYEKLDLESDIQLVADVELPFSYFPLCYFNLELHPTQNTIHIQYIRICKPYTGQVLRYLSGVRHECSLPNKYIFKKPIASSISRNCVSISEMHCQPFYSGLFLGY